MEFDEIKQIWDSQTKEPLFGFSENALHNRIISKKKSAYHITNISELLSIVVYAASGCFILGVNMSKQDAGIFTYLLAGWMLISALYVLLSRIQRIRADNQFDRSLRGDLQHAISVATYQVRLSFLLRLNILPLGALLLLGMWFSVNSAWFTIAILVFLILTYFASGWEHNHYKARKRELETLQARLDEVTVRPN